MAQLDARQKGMDDARKLVDAQIHSLQKANADVTAK